MAQVTVLPLILPPGKHTENYGTSQFLLGKLAISMAILNGYVNLPEGNPGIQVICHLFKP